MSSSDCCLLTCMPISQESGQVVWYSHLFKNFSQFVVIHAFKDFGIVSKTEINIFLELSCFFGDPVDVGNLTSGSSAFSESIMVHVLLKPGLKKFEHYFTSMWNECNCAVVWAFFGIAFIWDWNEHWPFLVLWPSSLNYKSWLPLLFLSITGTQIGLGLHLSVQVFMISWSMSVLVLSSFSAGCALGYPSAEAPSILPHCPRAAWWGFLLSCCAVLLRHLVPRRACSFGCHVNIYAVPAHLPRPTMSFLLTDSSALSFCF